MFVRGHAENLNGVDGAHVRFAVRYLLAEGDGLDVPHGVVSAASVVRNGSFEACVCVPNNAENYPQLAAVIFRPNSTTETPETVARAMYSGRYATGGDENVSHGLNALASAPMITAALAALEDRVATLTMLDGLTLSAADTITAGIVSTERPLAASTTRGTLEGNNIQFRWIMPGRVLPNERVVFVIDRNHNNRCDGADSGGFATMGANATLNAGSLTLLTGAALTPVCDALLVGTPRQ